MIKQKNAIFLFLALIPCLQSFVYADAGSINRPTNFQLPDNMPLPSVDDLFGNMTEEQIVQQIQEAQKLFESLSPEEMEEFAKIVDETWAKMPQADKDAIQDIATMVKPYFPEEEAPVKKSDENEEPSSKNKFPKVAVKESNTVQTLIDNISAIIDNILQKISSSKDLVEEFAAKWTSKFTFDKLKRQILALKEDRLSNKLVAKANAEDKELLEKLEEFYKNLKTKNDSFFVEDTFGLPSSNKSQNTKQLKQTKDILTVFDNAIDEVMPKIETFLKKHDPEALAMAKEADERTKKAVEHAKDASVKRGSAAAVPSPEPTRKSSQPTQQTTSGSSSYAPNYYDSYAPYGNYGNYGYGSSGYDYPSANYPQGDSSSKASAPKEEAKKEATTKKADDKKEETKKQKESSPYSDALDTVADYFDDFDNRAYQSFLNFLESDLPNYPKATERTGSISNPQTQEEWRLGTGSFEGKGFRTYTDSVKDSINTVSKQLKGIIKTCSEVERNIKKMLDDDLKKMANEKSLKELQNRTETFINDFNDARIKIRKQYTENVDPDKTFLTDDNLTLYQRSHGDLENKLDAFKTDLVAANDAVKDVFKRIKGSQRRNKIAAEKEAQKANALGY